MTDIKSSIDDLEIIYSGKAHITLGSILKISFSTMNMEISLINDPKTERNKISWELNNNDLRISLTNFNDPLGNGLLKPWQIGIYENKYLYMTFDTRYFSDGAGTYFIFSYIFYNGKEVENVK